MVTFNGSMRSLNAAINRMERERQRQNREAARRFKEQQKLQAILNAEQAVADWENYVETLQTIHKDCSDKVDWIEFNRTPKPKEPQTSDKNEKGAKIKLDNYSPSFFDKLFGLTVKRIKKLESEIATAKDRDKREYDDALEKHRDDLAEWNQIQIYLPAYLITSLSLM